MNSQHLAKPHQTLCLVLCLKSEKIPRHFSRIVFLSLISIFSVSIFSGCVLPNKKNEQVSNERSRRLVAQRKMNQMEKQMQALKDENSLLATALERKDLVEPKLPKEYKQELAGGDPQQQNEAMLYQKIVESYKTQDEKGLEAFEALLAKAFPQSVYLDDAAYYKALLAYHRGRSTEALEKFDAILQRYPNTRRWRDIQLAKAMIYRKMNLLDQERQVLAKMQQGPKHVASAIGVRPEARTEKIQSMNTTETE